MEEEFCFCNLVLLKLIRAAAILKGMLAGFYVSLTFLTRLNAFTFASSSRSSSLSSISYLFLLMYQKTLF